MAMKREHGDLGGYWWVEGDCEAILINPWVQEMVAVEDVLARGRKDSRRHVMDMLTA